MGALNALVEQIRLALLQWWASSTGELVFTARDTASLVVAIFAVIAALLLAWRALRGRLPGRTAIGLPALLPPIHESPIAFVRHAPFALFLAGLAFFCLALADPHASLSARKVSYPGRRLAVIMDASLSMMTPFAGDRLKTQSNTAFSNTMAAAEYFVRMRMQGRYRDLIALEQFGSEAYVITPFTTDYENLLLNLKMISDVEEWQRFPDQGTIIIKAIDEGVDLFEAFDFLDSSGNIMVIFSDGVDNNVQVGQLTLDRVLKKAVDHKIPVYMIRTAYSRGLFEVIDDNVWKRAIEATGGRFYPAADQESILRAIREIDAAATGRVDVREYTVREPRFSGFALIAVLLWTTALGLQMGLRMFRTFP